MKTASWFLGIILFSTFTTEVTAQTGPTGRIRGTVVDASSGRSIPHATVTGDGSTVGVVTDAAGEFSLPPVPVGRHNIRVTFLGYEPATVREVMVSSARETVLQIAMTESVLRIEDVVVRPRIDKEEPLNPMALAGARMLSIEEASRYAGGMDDPARLATSFAGAAGNVSGNAISIRGNSPQSMQWKLEGVEIPNPNHFPEVTSVGGGVLTAFSSQVLSNSDFFTGAFPAQYGNALSGVFDMQLRNGNNRIWEHAAQIGSLGGEFASEGPFKKEGQGSYLFNYRYSILAPMANALGGDLAEIAGVKYQDLSFKINLPTRRAGTFTLWGIGSIDSLTDPVPTDEEIAESEYLPSYFGSRQYMAAVGLSHRVFFSPNTYLKTTLAATDAENRLEADAVADWSGDWERFIDMTDRNTNLVLDTYINTKLSARHTNRTGLNVTGLFYDDNYNIAPGRSIPTGPIENFVDTSGSSMAATLFSQSTFALADRWTGELGLNVGWFALNRNVTVEPRAALRWRAARSHTLAVAGGLHSRRERLGYYFVEHAPDHGSEQVNNRDLDLSRAAHLTLSWDWSITEDLHLRVEPYYQYLWDVPVIRGNGRSIINLADFWMTDQLVNNGLARNYGVDMTLERYLRNGFYWMFTASIFDSRTTGDDRIWRNTRYNRNFVTNALAGKEWMLGRRRQHVLGLSVRLSVAGGEHYDPINEAASLAAERPIEDENRLMEGQNPTTLVAHLTVNWQIHRSRVTHEVGLKMLNLTGVEDYYGFDYNRIHHRMDRQSSAMSIPNVYYRISF